ncbi:uncharacterized protein LOC105178962 [Sesamum indicum]|uniref:Uncharacterized protein LOC105178962 n=1 Tax=Sesamum indicum TaxID=4182 RepID=A0A6I9UQC1_SESIN|nr:uncharacterized protein LOC105178962 [Sesamum indicum]
MAAFHSRSNSFPSQSHPVMESVEDHLLRLKSSEAASMSAASVCANLARLRDLHESIDNLIQMSSVQQALSQGQGENWVNELLEESLRLVDLCGFSRDVVRSTKESIQDLESSIRRNRGENATRDDINAYVASRKKMDKMVKKCIKNLKSFNQSATPLPAIGTMLKETEALDSSVLKSLLMLLSGETEGSKRRSWSLLSKTKRVHSETEQENGADQELFSLNMHKSSKGMDKITLKQLKATEMSIQELEEGLEALFRSLVKTRVSLLNILSH